MSTNTTIKIFHADHHGTVLPKLNVHIPHVNILGTNKCGKPVDEAFQRSHIFMGVKRRCNYAEPIYFKFGN